MSSFRPLEIRGNLHPVFEHIIWQNDAMTSELEVLFPLITLASEQIYSWNLSGHA
jgi:hypothetical protein